MIMKNEMMGIQVMEMAAMLFVKLKIIMHEPTYPADFYLLNL